jgi:hypothetical protein
MPRLFSSSSTPPQRRSIIFANYYNIHLSVSRPFIYGYTFSFLGLSSRKYHLRAGLFHLFLGMILWSTNLVIIDDFVFRRFLWLKLPYMDPDLGPLGPFFLGYCGIAALYSLRFWFGSKNKARSGSKVLILGVFLWLGGAVHDILATLGLIHTVQFLMAYGPRISVSVLVRPSMNISPKETANE